jgi:hypothetical protein
MIFSFQKRWGRNSDYILSKIGSKFSGEEALILFTILSYYFVLPLKLVSSPISIYMKIFKA